MSQSSTRPHALHWPAIHVTRSLTDLARAAISTIWQHRQALWNAFCALAIIAFAYLIAALIWQAFAIGNYDAAHPGFASDIARLEWRLGR
jgi:hypothetical protein